MPRRYTDYIDNRPSVRDSHPHQLQIFLASLPELSVGYLTLRYWEAVRDAKSFGSHMREAELNDSMKVACVGVWLFFFFLMRRDENKSNLFARYQPCLAQEDQAHTHLLLLPLSFEGPRAFSGSPSHCQEEGSAECVTCLQHFLFLEILWPNSIVLGAKSVLWGPIGELGRGTMNLLTC